jgi:hypothetical protein
MLLGNEVYKKVFNTNSKDRNLILHMIPKKDKGKDKNFISTDLKHNLTHQLDILHLPDDDGYKYLLVIVDIGSRMTDARPLKTMKMTEIIDNIDNIYKSNILKRPSFSIQCDNQFNNDEFKKYFKGVYIRFGKPYRHKQQATVEHRNSIISRVLNLRMNAQEMQTKEKSTEWVKYIPKIIEQINKILYRKYIEANYFDNPEPIHNAKVNGKY